MMSTGNNDIRLITHALNATRRCATRITNARPIVVLCVWFCVECVCVRTLHHHQAYQRNISERIVRRQ